MYRSIETSEHQDIRDSHSVERPPFLRSAPRPAELLTTEDIARAKREAEFEDLVQKSGVEPLTYRDILHGFLSYRVLHAPLGFGCGRKSAPHITRRVEDLLAACPHPAVVVILSAEPVWFDPPERTRWLYSGQGGAVLLLHRPGDRKTYTALFTAVSWIDPAPEVLSRALDNSPQHRALVWRISSTRREGPARVWDLARFLGSYLAQDMDRLGMSPSAEVVEKIRELGREDLLWAADVLARWGRMDSDGLTVCAPTKSTVRRLERLFGGCAMYVEEDGGGTLEGCPEIFDDPDHVFLWYSVEHRALWALQDILAVLPPRRREELLHTMIQRGTEERQP